MFAVGTQAKKWSFKDEIKLSHLGKQANEEYVLNYRKKNTNRALPEFLSPMEEKLLCQYYEYTLYDFCRKFKPPMPRPVTSCSHHFFKRFYLRNSVMDYHPKHIIVTCVFVACKVEEFNVSMSQFVTNVKGDRTKAQDIIISHELLLMEQMDYNIFIHHPFRAVEGFLIDIKARCSHIENPERFRPAIDEFINLIFFTDAYLIYSPSQIALAAVSYAGRKFGENIIESYISGVLSKNSESENMLVVKDAIKKMHLMIQQVNGAAPKDQIKAIEQKLEKCRNEENNPNSTVYKRKMEGLLEDDELEQNHKYARLAEKRNWEDQEILGMTPMVS